MPILSFTLTMLNRGSWNGKWSGENNVYAITKTFPNTVKGRERVEKLDGQSFYYGWRDGWGANVDVKAVTAKAACTLRSKSKGFCGYDWMVESILKHGKIYADHEVPKMEGVTT